MSTTQYNSPDRIKSHEPEESSLRFSAAVGAVSQSEPTRAFGHKSGSCSRFGLRSETPVPTFGPKTKTTPSAFGRKVGDFPTLGPKVPTALPTLGPKVRTFSTFGPKVKPRRKQTIFKWLRDRVSGIDVGVEIEDDNGKHPIHLNSNSQVLDHFAQLRNEERSFLKRISNMNFVDHFDEVSTFYFSGAAEPKKPETLILIDIDCKKTGSLQGAMAFAEFLRNEHFANLYIETSTHGRGAHGFFVLDKCGFGDEYVNRLLLHRLQSWLRRLLKEGDWDVENVEIKGTLPVIVWGKERLEVTNYRSGTLAKLPRLGTSEKEDALRNTTRLSVYDLMKLPVVEKDDTETDRKANSGGGVAGSVTGKAIDDDEIGKIDGHYGNVAAALLKSHEIKTAGRTVVTNEDVAIFLLLLRFFSQNMNQDGSMPVKRWKKMWNALHEAGDVGRAFCPQRFKVIRDHLSSLQLLDWKDQTYQIGWYDEDGKYHKGNACKWQASEKLMGVLQEPAEQTRCEKGEGEASFIRTRILPILKSIVQLPPEETKQPILIVFDSHLRINPDEIAPLITTFEAFIGVAA